MKNTNKIDIISRLGESVAKIKGSQIANTQKEIAEILQISEVTLSRALKGNEKYLTDSFLNNFSSKFNIGFNWLVNGEGEMFKDEIIKAPEGKTKRRGGSGKVAFYDTDFIGGRDIATYEENAYEPAYYMDVPEFSGCSAFRIYNDSMENLIKSGSIVFGTKLENWRDHLEYGQIYGIVCHDNRRFIKYIKRWNENPKEYFYLVSENEFYDPWEIQKDKIKNIWLIHGWINKRV